MLPKDSLCYQNQELLLLGAPEINSEMKTAPGDGHYATGHQGLVGQSDVLTLSLSSTESLIPLGILSAPSLHWHTS